MKKKILIYLLLAMILVGFPIKANAIVINSQQKWFYGNKSGYAGSTTSGQPDSSKYTHFLYKYVGDDKSKPAFCAQHYKTAPDGQSFVEVSTFPASYGRVVGEIINYTYVDLQKNWGGKTQSQKDDYSYYLATLAINSYLYDTDYGEKGRDYVDDGYPGISTIISKAKERANLYVSKTSYSGTAVGSFKTSDDWQLTKQSEGIYVSSEITFTPKNSTIGGNSVKYTAKPNARSSGTTVKICKTADTDFDSCSNSLSLSNNSSSPTSFYMKVQVPPEVDLTSGAVQVRVDVSMSNASTYHTAQLYYPSSSSIRSSVQTMAVIGDDEEVSRSGSVNKTLTIPEEQEPEPLKFTNRIRVYKYQADGESYLEGATLLLYNKANPDVTLTCNTTSSYCDFSCSGQVEVDDENPRSCNVSDTNFALTTGQTYCIKETKAPPGYLLTSSTDCGTLKLNTSLSLDLTNEKNEVRILKQDADSSTALNGVSLVLYKSNNEKYDEWVSGKSYRSFPGIPAGDYYLVETATVKGYILDTNRIDFSIDTSGKITLKSSYTNAYVRNDSTLVVTNQATKIAISKHAIAGSEELPGAHLRICKAQKTVDDKYEIVMSDDGECVLAESLIGGTSWVSEDKPNKIQGIPAGTYYLIETVAPDSYAKLENAILFTVDDAGKIIINDATSTAGNAKVEDDGTLTIYNRLIKFNISKQAVGGGPELPGATLNICMSEKNDDGELKKKLGEDGKCILASDANGEASWVSGDAPHIVEGLPAGTYFLEEVVAPSGYGEAETIQFTVDEYGNIKDEDGKDFDANTITMYDEVLKNVETGASYIVMVSILGLASIGYVLYRVNKKIV